MMSTEKPLLIYDVVYPPDLSERIKSHGKYDVFTLALNKFENDKRHGGNFHYEWVGKVAMITEKILISERIEDSRKGSYSPRSTPKQSEGASEPDGKKVLIRLSDGTTKTKDVKDRLKDLKALFYNKEFLNRHIYQKIIQKSKAKMLHQLYKSTNQTK